MSDVLTLTDFTEESYLEDISGSVSQAMGRMSITFSRLAGMFEVFSRSYSLYTAIGASTSEIKTTFNYVRKRVVSTRFSEIAGEMVPVPEGMTGTMVELYTAYNNVLYVPTELVDILESTDRYISSIFSLKQITTDIRELKQNCNNIINDVKESIGSLYTAGSAIERQTISEAYGNSKGVISCINNQYKLDAKDPTSSVKKLHSLTKTIDKTVTRYSKKESILESVGKPAIEEMIRLLEHCINATEAVMFYEESARESTHDLYVGCKIIANKI